jgi:hypothetical protein
MSAKHGPPRRYLASIEDHAKSRPRFSGGSKGKHKCCGGGTFETALPRAGPDLEPILPFCGRRPSSVRSWRFGAKPRTIMRRRLECRRLLREKHCRLGAVEAVDATRAVDCQIRNSLEPHNRTAILRSKSAIRANSRLRYSEQTCDAVWRMKLRLVTGLQPCPSRNTISPPNMSR